MGLIHKPPFNSDPENESRCRVQRRGETVIGKIKSRKFYRIQIFNTREGGKGLNPEIKESI
jgi:hypothetical protein